MTYLGLASSWSFFAPEPVSYPLSIDYVLEKKDGESVNGRFPDDKNLPFFRDLENRRKSLSSMLFMVDGGIKNMFVRYLCLNNSGTISVKLWKVLAIPPTREMVLKGEKKITDPIDFKLEVLGSFFCDEGEK